MEIEGPRRRPTTWRSRLGTCAAVALCACSTPVDGKLTVGVQAEPIPNLQTVRVTTADTATNDVDAFTLPWEKALTTRAPELRVKVEGLGPSGEVLVTRSARAPMPPTMEDRLLRVRLQSACAGVACADGQTCVSGRCQTEELLLADLERFRANWATDVPDLCRPANPGMPEVVVGTGQTDYLPLKPSQTLQLEPGPQGGHHVYVALRQRNLHRSGSLTTIAGQQPGGVTVTPTTFIFTFDPDEGGYCKLYGLRYQVDTNGLTYHQFLDKDLDITVTVKDASGNLGTGTARIHIAKTLVGQ